MSIFYFVIGILACSDTAEVDYDGDGKVESSKEEYFGSKDKAIKKAMGKKTDEDEKKKDEEVEGIEHVDLYELRSLRRIVRDSRPESHRHKSSSRMNSTKKKKKTRLEDFDSPSSSNAKGISLRSHIHHQDSDTDSEDDPVSSSGNKNQTSYISESDEENDSLDIRSYCKRR